MLLYSSFMSQDQTEIMQIQNKSHTTFQISQVSQNVVISPSRGEVSVQKKDRPSLHSDFRFKFAPTYHELILIVYYHYFAFFKHGYILYFMLF